MATIRDLVAGIQQEYTTTQEDDIIYELIDSTSSAELLQWRTDYYADNYRQAYRALDQVVFSDNYNVNQYRSDMEVYDTLVDLDNTAVVPIEYSDTDYDYLQVEYPTSRSGVNIIRLSVDTAVKCFFGLSNDGTVWKYYSATTGDHDISNTSTVMTEYSDTTSARTAYVNLVSGTNKIFLPSNRQMRYGRVYFTGDSTSIVNVSALIFLETLYADALVAGTISTQYVTIESTDGKTTFDGNTIEVRDDNNVLRVRLGKLN